MPGSDDPLVCPSCAIPHPLEDRFCRDCGMPLVYAGVPDGREQEVTDRQERARKIKPQFAEGPLVKVAAGRHQAEAELIQGLLLEEGVPSMLKRSAGFDVPDMLAAGPRDVLVARSGVEVARQVLLQAELLPGEGSAVAARAARGGGDAPSRVAIALLAAFVLVALIAWIGTELLV
jgi:hypothetical protein